MAKKPSHATVPLPMEKNEISCCDMKNQKKFEVQQDQDDHGQI